MGLTNKLESKLDEKIKDVIVVQKTNAVKNSYEQTIVVDVSQQRSEKAKEIANLLGAKIGTLPVGETAPVSDILVIIGKDYR